MRAIRPAVPVIAAALAAAGCSSTTVVERPAPATVRSTAVVLGIPPGHLPPPGQCRVWIPGRPPGRQARARACDGILASAPVGAWVLYRPGRDRRVVHVRHVHDTRPGVIVRVRVFEAQSGKYVREERP